MANILIVDDSRTSRRVLRDMLEKHGHVVVDEATNGQEGFDGYGKLNPDIVTMDITMPVMDGIQTAKKVEEMIENKEINDDTKIIFVSGNIDGSDLQQSLLKIKCVKECLQKPVQITKYQKMLERYYKK